MQLSVILSIVFFRRDDIRIDVKDEPDDEYGGEGADHRAEDEESAADDRRLRRLAASRHEAAPGDDSDEDEDDVGHRHRRQRSRVVHQPEVLSDGDDAEEDKNPPEAPGEKQMELASSDSSR